MSDEASEPLPKVLIVDDSRMVRASLIKLIRGRFEVREEADGEAGWQAAHQGHHRRPPPGNGFDAAAAGMAQEVAGDLLGACAEDRWRFAVGHRAGDEAGFEDAHREGCAVAAQQQAFAEAQ